MTIDVFQNHSDFIKWVNSFGDSFNQFFDTDYDPFEIKIRTGSGLKFDINTNDVVIRDPNSMYYLLEKDVFEKEYETIN